MIVPQDRPATIAELLAELDPDGTIRVRRRVRAETDDSPPPIADCSRNPSFDGLPPLYKRIERASKWLKGYPDAIDGAGGSEVTFTAAFNLYHGFALDEGAAFDLLWTEYNPRCQGPWDEPKLRKKVRDAASKPCNKPRGWKFANDHLRRQRPATPSAAPTPTSTTPPPAASEPAGHPRPAAPAATAERPGIVQQPAQLRDVVAAGIAALVAANEPPTLFVHGDALVRLDASADEKPVKPLSKSQLRLSLSDAADFLNENVSKDGEVTRKPAYPRPEVVESIQDHAGGWNGVPTLKAVANVPVVTAASGLLTRPGFDPASGVYLLPAGHHDVDPVPERPDADDVEEAKELLLGELLGDFPFRDEASRANTLALLLLPFVRDLIDGPTPLHHIDAPQEGTGKSLLAETWAAVALGRPLPSFGEVTRPDDWQKTLLAALMEAPPVVFFDNLNQTLDSGTLASAITSPVISGRVLGFSRIVTAPVRNVWVSSANNLTMSRELVRRTLCIRLLPNRQHAYQKRTFKHRLPTWAFKQRGRLVWACLVLCQAWVANGKPPGRELLGKFEGWSVVMDGILCNAGVDALLANMDEFRSGAVDETDDWDAFVAAWWEAYHGAWVTVRDLFPLAQGNDMLQHARGDRSDESQRARLGHAIKKHRDAVFADGYQIVAPELTAQQKANKKVVQYRLVRPGHTDPPELELRTSDVPD